MVSMKISLNLLNLFCSLLFMDMYFSELGAAPTAKIIDFDDAQSQKMTWSIVNDGVMGGLSRGNVDFNGNGTMVFRGQLSLDNNGGFSSVRSSRRPLNLSSSKGLELRVRGDGRTYEFRLTTDERFRGREMSFKVFLPTQRDWKTVLLPFTDFQGTWRGMSLPDKTFDPSKVQRMSIFIADKKEGSFEIEIDWIGVAGESIAFEGSPSDDLFSILKDRSLHPKKRIDMAIEAGVPLYNQGDPLACAEIYQAVIESLIIDEKLSKEVQLAIERSLLSNILLAVDERAWGFRNVLDKTSDYLDWVYPDRF
jgi:monofunctional biosynthetic peptidoglycan transglycosylase